MIAEPPSPGRYLLLAVAGLFPERMRERRGTAFRRLETWLGRGKALPGDRVPDFEALLFHLFGIPLAAKFDAPVAPLSYLADGGAPGELYWLRADPVHMVAEGADLVLTDPEGLALEPGEAEALAAELRPLFDEPGWRLEAPAPGRWYLGLPRGAPRLRTTPLGRAVGRGVLARLPEGEEALLWHRRLNEVQAALHLSPVNQRREARGLPVINSLWFWGGGRLPRPGAAPCARVRADAPLARGLARLHGLEPAPAPASAREWLAAGPETPELVLPAGAGGGPGAWPAFVEDFFRNWVEPLDAALAEGGLQALTLYTEGCPPLRLDRRRRWWRPRTRLAALID